MRFANYSRKSVYSDKSDSIKNQERMCREYCDARFPGQVDVWLEYSDEDYTGANTDRPDLQRMLSDIKDGLIDVLVVYQLDRLSRSVRDFSYIYDILEKHQVQFLSIKENIDVSTPIGRAMMNISASFAQMERETTAARVTDNMIGLAQKGLWVGGRPPVGYTTRPILLDGRRHHVLVPDPEGAKYVNWIFDEYILGRGTLQGMEHDFRVRGIRSQNGKFFSTNQFYQILTMPYCVPATPEIYDFYAGKGCQMLTPRESWDGKHGVMVYGRTSEKSGHHERTTPDKWLVVVGIHEPFMEPGKWLAAQARLDTNKDFKMTSRYPPPLLKGIVQCSCGRRMTIARKPRQHGLSSWYHCARRDREGKESCGMPSVKCEILDNQVLDIFRQITVDRSLIMKYVETSPAAPPVDYRRQIEVCESKITRLTSSLAFADDSPAAKYIISQIESEDAKVQDLRKKLSQQEVDQRRGRQLEKTAEQKADEIEHMITHLEGFDEVEKNRLARNIIKECRWDGESLFLRL